MSCRGIGVSGSSVAYMVGGVRVIDVWSCSCSCRRAMRIYVMYNEKTITVTYSPWVTNPSSWRKLGQAYELLEHGMRA
jgi:hypothetical protein